MKIKTCLFVASNSPFSFWHSGTSNRIAMAYYSLSRIGIEMHVVRFLDEQILPQTIAYEEQFHGETGESRNLAASWEDIRYRRVGNNESWLRHIDQSLFDPVALIYPEAEYFGQIIRSRCEKLEPDLIWGVWIPSSAGIYYSNPRVPWISTHTDWMFQLMKIRAHWKSRITPVRRRDDLFSTMKLQWRSWLWKRADLQYLKECAAVETGSTVQAREMQGFGLENIHVVPSAYEPVAIDLEDYASLQDPQIVHLGSLATTSNKIGLSGYLKEAHPFLDDRLRAQGHNARLVIIGDTKAADTVLREMIMNAKATCTGFVHDLSTILRPYDIQIIPYEYISGLRTKVALHFNYAQVVVATRASVRGMPELVAGENCILVDSVKEFPEALEHLIQVPELRVKYGRNARATFEREYTLDRQIERYQNILDSLNTGPN